jgi:hypothetical protein
VTDPGATLGAMAKKKREPEKHAGGRPRTGAGADDDERATNAVVRLGGSHRDELDALIAEHGLADRSKAVRWLIEQSAARRAKRGR